MAEEDTRRADKAQSDANEEDEPETLLKRFPSVPPVPDLPEMPRIAPSLPPHPDTPREGKLEPGSYNKMAIAATAASSFIMPIIVLGYGGWWLDQKLKHETAWLSLLGVVLGFAAGVVSLMNSIKRLSD